jgi:hypothetical protein
MYDHHPLPPVGMPMPMPPQAGAPLGGLDAYGLDCPDVSVERSGRAIGRRFRTVTNLMTGKGRFQVNYLGEILTGEATRVSNEDKRGVASAYGSKGTIMSCDYQMTTPYQGTGDCRISTGALV